MFRLWASLLLMILPYLKDPKLWESWYIPYYGSGRIYIINSRAQTLHRQTNLPPLAPGLRFCGVTKERRSPEETNSAFAAFHAVCQLRNPEEQNYLFFRPHSKHPSSSLHSKHPSPHKPTPTFYSTLTKP